MGEMGCGSPMCGFIGEMGDDAGFDRGKGLLVDDRQRERGGKHDDKSGREAQRDRFSVATAQQRPQSGFLNQSIDEIARLYVESPFSW